MSKYARNGLSSVSRAIALSAALLACDRGANAQICTTQARMEPGLRNALADAALAVGAAVKSGDAAAVKALSATELASNFGGTELLLRTTAANLSGDTLRVTQLYELNASDRKVGDTGNADFSCLLAGTGAETDFSISGLPAGDFGFAMVEAAGDRPWLVSMLLQKQGPAWKMAGLYPRARTAAGRDGLWYWTAARERATAKQPLLAWLYYAQAEALLQPAPFMDTSNLDKLRTEQRSAGPVEIANGLNEGSPLAVKGNGGGEFKLNALTSETASDGKSLHLIVHLAGSTGDSAAIKARSEAAARALVGAHPELKQAYSSVYVFADMPQGNPPVASLPMNQIQ